jgi:hypothetical protein
MTAREKAQDGLRQLKEATVEYLATRPQGARTKEVREALGLNLDSDLEGQHKGFLFWGLFNLLRQEGKVERRLIDGRNYILLARHH